MTNSSAATRAPSTLAWYPVVAVVFPDLVSEFEVGVEYLLDAGHSAEVHSLVGRS